MDLGSVVGGFVAGVFGAIGPLWAYAHGHLNLERTRRRTDKISLTNELLASRYVLSTGYTPFETELRDFHRCIASVPFIFGDDKKVLEKYDEYFSSPNDTDKLVNLIQQCALSVGLPKDRIQKSYLKATFTLGNGKTSQR